MKKHYKPLLPFLYSAITSFPFTEYDFDAMTEYEILQALTHKVNECIGVINDIQGDIDSIVVNILNEWLADGTIDEIISETVLGYLKIFYVPEEFGAKGDGITDDTDAFDAACKAMADGDIKILFIPAKTYVIGSTIAIPEGCSVIGTGRDSVIFYSENNTNYGVGLTNAGSNVTIYNIRVEQNREPGEIILEGSQTGCISFSTLDAAMCGKINTPSGTWTRKNNENLRAENIFSDNSPYILQTETTNDYGITNVVVRNVDAPKSLISFMSKPDDGVIKNIHYENINAAYIRCDQGGNNVINGTVSDFYCTGMKLSAPGLVAENGVIDATDDVMYSLDYALLLKAGSAIRSVKLKGRASNSLRYALRLAGNEGAYIIDGCEIGGFNIFSYNGSDVTGDFSQPILITNSVVDWNNIGTRSAIQMIATGCDITDHNPKSPVYNDIPRSLTNITDILDFNSTSQYDATLIPTSFVSKGSVIKIRMSRNLPADTTLFTVDSAFRGYIGAEGGKVNVHLLNSDGSKNAHTIAEFNSSGALVLKTAGLTMTDYNHYIIDGEMPINPISW